MWPRVQVTSPTVGESIIAGEKVALDVRDVVKVAGGFVVAEGRALGGSADLGTGALDGGVVATDTQGPGDVGEFGVRGRPSLDQAVDVDRVVNHSAAAGAAAGAIARIDDVLDRGGFAEIAQGGRGLLHRWIPGTVRGCVDNRWRQCQGLELTETWASKPHRAIDKREERILAEGRSVETVYKRAWLENNGRKCLAVGASRVLNPFPSSFFLLPFYLPPRPMRLINKGWTHLAGWQMICGCQCAWGWLARYRLRLTWPGKDTSRPLEARRTRQWVNGELNTSVLAKTGVGGPGTRWASLFGPLLPPWVAFGLECLSELLLVWGSLLEKSGILGPF